MGSRILPDDNDIVVWKLDDSSAPFINSSTSPSAPSHAVSDLATLSGSGAGAPRLQQPSIFAPYGENSCIQFTANNDGSPRNFISGANNFEPTVPFTISGWINLRSYNTTGFVQHIFNKQQTAGVWSGGTFGAVTMQNQSTGSSTYAISLAGLTQTVGFWTMQLNMWCHVGITYDGSVVQNYLNGNLVQQWAATGSVNWAGHGPWFFGAIPSGSGNPEETAVSVCDFRVANIVRDQAYFQNIYRTAVFTDALGRPIYKYYKMRAFDTACTEPTPVIWVSRNLDYTDAPTPPCGSISTLGPIEIMDSWEALG